MYLIASLERGEEAIFHNPVLRRPGEVLVHHGGEVHVLKSGKLDSETGYLPRLRALFFTSSSGIFVRTLCWRYALEANK